MPDRPRQRPPRHAARDTQGPPKPDRSPTPPLVDPQTVIAVRRATARTVHAIRRVAVRLGRGCAGASVTAARWTWPRLRRATSAMVRGLGRATVATARWSWGRRRGLARLGHRVLWWGALAILLLVGRALLGSGGDPELLASATIWFATGLSMSVLVLLGAPETRMRVGAFALAGGHGSLALLAVLLG